MQHPKYWSFTLTESNRVLKKYRRFNTTCNCNHTHTNPYWWIYEVIFYIFLFWRILSWCTMLMFWCSDALSRIIARTQDWNPASTFGQNKECFCLFVALFTDLIWIKNLFNIRVSCKWCSSVWAADPLMSRIIKINQNLNNNHNPALIPHRRNYRPRGAEHESSILIDV